jgi:hypothetical protein
MAAVFAVGSIADAALGIVTGGESSFAAGVGRKAGTKAAGQGANYVYRAINKAGEVEYVGITSNLARRAGEQLREKGIRIVDVMSGFSRADARAVEQALIDLHGLGKDGGTLLWNKINSIAKSNQPLYNAASKRGRELLQSIGY